MCGFITCSLVGSNLKTRRLFCWTSVKGEKNGVGDVGTIIDQLGHTESHPDVAIAR